MELATGLGRLEVSASVEDRMLSQWGFPWGGPMHGNAGASCLPHLMVPFHLLQLFP